MTISTPIGTEYTHTEVCHDKDQYNKKRGLTIALGRTLKQIYPLGTVLPNIPKVRREGEDPDLVEVLRGGPNA